MHNLQLEGDLARVYVSVFRGWHLLEQRLNSGIEPIDMDLADPSIAASQFDSRDSTDAALQDLLNRLPDNHPILRQHVSAARAVLALLAGAVIPGREYVQRTVDLPCIAINAATISESRVRVETALIDIGYAPDLSHLPTEPDLPRALTTALSTTKSVVQALREELHLEHDTLGFSVSQVTNSGYWKSWVSGNVQNGLSIRFNTTPRRPYFIGDALSLALHEIAGHALQMMQRRALIADGRLAEAYGITGVFGPEQFLFEGLAETMPDSLAKLGILEVGPELRLARYYEQLRVFIYHNAHCMLLRGECMEDATTYVFRNLPSEQNNTVVQELRDRTTDPLLCAYLFVYGVSDALFAERIGASNHQQVAQDLYAWYNVPSTWNEWHKNDCASQSIEAQ